MVLPITNDIEIGPAALERVKGIEPSSQAWEARILPLNHTRIGSDELLQTLTPYASVKKLQVLYAQRGH